MLFSHHSHSGQFCKHAAGTLEDVVLMAISKGFNLYGLTEHVPRYRSSDLYPEEEGVSLDKLIETFDAFVVEAHRLKSAYADRITLLIGLETEYITKADLDGLDILLRKHGTHIEYIIGSVHHVNEIPIDFDLTTFQQAKDSFAHGNSQDDALVQLFLSYFDAQYEVMQRFYPEVIGHFDLCRLYHPTVKFKDYPDVWAKIERNARFATDYGALFEINAAAFRKGWDDAYPGSDIVELINTMGGRFTLSDDSHGPHAVGLNYDRLQEYVQRVEVKELWYLGRSDKSNAAGRYLQPILTGHT